MTTWVVLGAGESLTQDQVEHCRGRATVIACNNAYALAPWADAMAACDMKWWDCYGRDAVQFGGRKYAPHMITGTTHLRTPDHPLGCNTGMYAMMVAREHGASRILLLGIDLTGTHFFGRHPSHLRNANDVRHTAHRNQFNKYSGPAVVNCSPISTLTAFPRSSVFVEL